MYFTKIELHNFGIYEGTHVMSLSPKNGQRNITLVGGLNGRGKTTFHDAILLALYGRNALKYIQEKERSYERLLLNRINKHASDGSAYISISMRLDDGTDIRIIRKWTKRKSKAAQEFRVEKNGTVDGLLGENWDFYIDEILPFGIARFFFFNNEKITQLADDVSFEQIKVSIKSAIGISAIEKAIEHLDGIVQKKEKALKDFEASEENLGYRETSHQIAEVDERLSKARDRANDLELQLEELSATADAREKEFWAAGGNLSKDRETIKAEKERLANDAERTHDNIMKLASDAASPLFMCRELVSKVYNTNQAFQKSQMERHSDEFRHDSYHRIVDRIRGFGIPDELYDELITVLSEELLKPFSEANGLPNINFAGTSMLLLEQLLADTFKQFPFKVRSLLDKVEQQESELMSLDSHLDAADDKTVAMRLFDALKDVENERSTVAADYKQQLGHIQALTNERASLSAKRSKFIKAITAKENTNDDNARMIRYAAMSIDVLTELKIRLQRQKVEKLSDTVTNCFKALVEKESLVKKIHIDSETLDVSITDIDGKVIQKDQLSAGEQQMFAVSIVWALALTSGYKAPVVIDTPMARLDSQNRSNFVLKYLPAASEQVIVLSTDEEIYGQYLAQIQDHVIDCYTLLYHEEGQYTEIVKGYFGEAVGQ